MARAGAKGGDWGSAALAQGTGGQAGGRVAAATACPSVGTADLCAQRLLRVHGRRCALSLPPRSLAHPPSLPAPEEPRGCRSRARSAANLCPTGSGFLEFLGCRAMSPATT